MCEVILGLCSFALALACYCKGVMRGREEEAKMRSDFDQATQVQRVRYRIS